MMMTMEEKGISYNKNLLDEQKMPDWYAALLISASSSVQNVAFLTGKAQACKADFPMRTQATYLFTEPSCHAQDQGCV